MGRGGWAGRIVSGARAASPEFFFEKTFSERERRVKYNTTWVLCFVGRALQWNGKSKNIYIVAISKLFYYLCNIIKEFIYIYAKQSWK